MASPSPLGLTTHFTTRTTPTVSPLSESHQAAINSLWGAQYLGHSTSSKPGNKYPNRTYQSPIRTSAPIRKMAKKRTGKGGSGGGKEKKTSNKSNVNPENFEHSFD